MLASGHPLERLERLKVVIQRHHGGAAGDQAQHGGAPPARPRPRPNRMLSAMASGRCSFEYRRAVAAILSRRASSDSLGKTPLKTVNPLYARSSTGLFIGILPLLPRLKLFGFHA